MAKELRLNVTSKLIEKATFSPTNCPIALAFKEHGESVSVHPNRDGYIHYGFAKKVKMSPAMLKFVNAYDKRNKVHPVTFKFKLP